KDALAQQTLALKLMGMRDLERHRRALESVPRVIGLGKYGQPIHGVYNRDTGQWEPTTPAQPATFAPKPAAGAVETIPTVAQAQTEAADQEQMPEKAKVVEGLGDVGAFEQDTKGPIPVQPWQNANALEGETEEDKNLIKGIAAGRIKPLSRA